MTLGRRKLTALMEAGTTRRMGRPPLKRNVATVMLSFRVPADLVAKIDAAAGESTRGEWIRKALEKAVKGTPPSRPDSKMSRSAE